MPEILRRMVVHLTLPAIVVIVWSLASILPRLERVDRDLGETSSHQLADAPRGFVGNVGSLPYFDDVSGGEADIPMM